ncbi:MAG TPA: hypothetical protein VEI02_12080, partial [Planctomycetota bacterium]|nr:hypothetical protein [Planctomycetota bacterium]
MFTTRLAVLFAVVCVVFIGLTARLFSLQAGGPEVAERALFLDAMREQPLPAARGALRDRDGVVLRASREAFDVEVFAATFRERSLAEALADLAVLLAPGDPPDRDAVVARLEVEPEAVAAEICALPIDVLRLPVEERRAELEQRGARLLPPHGTLLRPRAALRRRPWEALLVATSRERVRRVRDLENAVEAGADDVGELLEVAPEALATRMREETAALAALGDELRAGGAREVRAAIAGLCLRQAERVERVLEERLRDAVLLQAYGARRLDPRTLGRRTWLERVRTAAAPIEDPAAARRALAAASDVLGGGRVRRR